jgi:hypothetical protein
MFKTIKTAEQLAQEKAQQRADGRIAELKQLLAETDYAALTDYDRKKPNVIAQRQQWRNEIRSLEEFEA